MTGTLCECCWKEIIDEEYTIDELTMCEDCLLYHYGEDSENESFRVICRNTLDR